MSGQNKGRSEKIGVNAFLSLGSNIGDRMKNLNMASQLIQKNAGKIPGKNWH